MTMTPEQRRVRRNEQNKGYYYANHAERLEYHKRWRAAHRDVLLQRDKQYKLKQAYGLATGAFQAMLAAQCGRCAICGSDKPRGKGAFHVDHDHSTGVIRGLLCHQCNIGIGVFRDSPALLAMAIAYLKRFTKHEEN